MKAAPIAPDPLAVRLKLPGHPPVPARVDVVHLPSRVRLTRAILSLLGFWAVIPLVALIPPHVPWALIFFGLGTYFAYVNWVGVYQVTDFEGACPRCGSPLTIQAGAKIDLPRTMICYACHHEPRLEMAEVGR